MWVLLRVVTPCCKPRESHVSVTVLVKTIAKHLRFTHSPRRRVGVIKKQTNITQQINKIDTRFQRYSEKSWPSEGTILCFFFITILNYPDKVYCTEATLNIVLSDATIYRITFKFIVMSKLWKLYLSNTALKRRPQNPRLATILLLFYR